MVSPHRAFRVPNTMGIFQPPIIVGRIIIVATTPTWDIEPTTSSLEAMCPNYQVMACGAYFTIDLSCRNLPYCKAGYFRNSSVCLGVWKLRASKRLHDISNFVYLQEQKAVTLCLSIINSCGEILPSCRGHIVRRNPLLCEFFLVTGITGISPTAFLQFWLSPLFWMIPIDIYVWQSPASWAMY